MLHFLRIENLALMDAVEMEFSAGYTVVTGETGAGKSVLLGALSLLSGNRADRTLIREGASECRVEAQLSSKGQPAISDFLQTADLPGCEDEQLILTRILARDKPSRVMINGAIATLAQLQALSRLWIDFHGPGEPQKLFSENEQRALLDAFSGQLALLEAYQLDYRRWRALLAKIEEMRTSQQLSPEEAAFLTDQVAAIDALRLSPQLVADQEEAYQRLSNAQQIASLSQQAVQCMQGKQGILDQLRALANHLRQLADIDRAWRESSDRSEGLLIELDDLATEVAQQQARTDIRAADAQSLEKWMEQWLRLSRRYGPAVEQVLQKREKMAMRLDLLGNTDAKIEQLVQAAATTEAALKKRAVELRINRIRAAKELARQAQAHLKNLGFKHPGLHMEITAEDGLKAHGDSSCRITFAPNPGRSPLPLNRIASSGEMARVMLAIKSVLASADATPVLVFDEVDANIGGEIATAVSRLMQQLGQHHQVFCITHLPQVASGAAHHFVVRKEQDATSTSMRIDCLDGERDALLDEFARMLGDRNSAAARQHAASLLAS